MYDKDVSFFFFLFSFFFAADNMRRNVKRWDSLNSDMTNYIGPCLRKFA